MNSPDRPAPLEQHQQGHDGQAGNTRSAARPPLHFIAAVFLVIGALFLIDRFLARVEHADLQAASDRAFREGQLLENEKRYPEALEQYRAALSMSRNNRKYQLATVHTLVAEGNLQQAKADLEEPLQEDSTDGAANLLMARILTEEKKYPEAEAYYHRAIDGVWATDTAANRLKARFELIDLLARLGAKRELLAELLSVQGEAPGDQKTRKRLAGLFLEAGSPNRAAELYRESLQEHPEDAEAYSGLGEAQFALGNYHLAQSAYQAALRLKPDDWATRTRLDICNGVMNLDPMLRGLSSSARYARSRKIAELAFAELQRCTSSVNTPMQGSVAELLTSAQKELQKKAPLRPDSEAVEANMSLAENLWQTRNTVCGEPADVAANPLALLFGKLSR